MEFSETKDLLEKVESKTLNQQEDGATIQPAKKATEISKKIS